MSVFEDAAVDILDALEDIGDTVMAAYIDLPPDQAKSYYDAHGADAELRGVFDRDYYGSSVSDVEVAGTVPVLHVLTSDYHNKGLTRRRALMISGDVYEIINTQPDSAGMTIVELANG